MFKYPATFLSIVFLAIFMLIFSSSECPAGDNKFDIEFQTGFFVPDNPGIIGERIVTYDDSGNITGVTSRGFGYGREIILSLSYRTPGLVLRLNSGKRWLRNGPSDEEKKVADYYDDNKMSIYPIVLNVLKEIETENSGVIPFAGLGAGIYLMRWSEKYVDRTPEYREAYFSKDTKTAIGFDFILGARYSVLTGVSLKFEYSYDFVRSKINIVWLPHFSGNSVVNAGGSSFRIGLVYSL